MLCICIRLSVDSLELVLEMCGIGFILSRRDRSDLLHGYWHDCKGDMGNDLGGSKVTSQNMNCRHITKMAATPSPADSRLALRDRGNCSIAAKFGTDLECHIAENTGERI